MQEITKKLHNQALREFKPAIEPLARGGLSESQIVGYYQKWLQHKTDEFYRKSKGPQPIGNILSDFIMKLQSGSPDSQAERVFYQMLYMRGIRFEFQYNIGPYRADYLFAGFLVVELDGPQHDKEHDLRRDEYMRRMGYKIIRVPIWVLVSCPEAVLDEIQEVIKAGRAIP